MKNNQSSGFTLIELLIVIAIIGTLASVLIPNLLNARAKAIDTATQSFSRSIITYIASADSTAITAAQKAALQSITTCTAQQLLDEGASATFPAAVSTCQVNYNTTTFRYEVTVTSTRGTSIVQYY